MVCLQALLEWQTMGSQDFGRTVPDILFAGRNLRMVRISLPNRQVTIRRDECELSLKIRDSSLSFNLLTLRSVIKSSWISVAGPNYILLNGYIFIVFEPVFPCTSKCWMLEVRLGGRVCKKPVQRKLYGTYRRPIPLFLKVRDWEAWLLRGCG